MSLSEKPLSDPMERALIALVDRARSDRDARVARQWHNYARVTDQALALNGIRADTIVALEERGLVESDASGRYFRYSVARATDAGIALCDSMGD